MLFHKAQEHHGVRKGEGRGRLQMVLGARHWRGGAARKAPVFNGEGHNLVTVLRVCEGEVNVWKRLVAGHMPDEEKGLRLLAAG